MAKQPETVDRIQIIAEAPLALVGAGLAALTKLGFENVGYKLITEELRFKNRKVHEVSATELAAEFVTQNARFKLTDLTAHFKDAGRSPTGAYGAIKKLVQTRVIAKSGDEYTRVEAIAAQKGQITKPKTARGRQKPYDVSNKVLIQRAIKGRKHITVVELRELFAKQKRNAKSISPILSKMVETKRIKSIGDGKYDVLPIVANKKPAAAVVNGSGVTANG